MGVGQKASSDAVQWIMMRLDIPMRGDGTVEVGVKKSINVNYLSLRDVVIIINDIYCYVFVLSSSFYHHHLLHLHLVCKYHHQCEIDLLFLKILVFIIFARILSFSLSLSLSLSLSRFPHSPLWDSSALLLISSCHFYDLSCQPLWLYFASPDHTTVCACQAGLRWLDDSTSWAPCLSPQRGLGVCYRGGSTSIFFFLVTKKHHSFSNIFPFFFFFFFFFAQQNRSCLESAPLTDLVLCLDPAHHVSSQCS